MIITLAGALSSALTHFAANGLALILEEADARNVRWWWEDGSAAKAKVSADGTPDPGEMVRQHAAARASESWLQSMVQVDGTTRHLFSPRGKKGESEQGWDDFIACRHKGLDALNLWLDHQLIGALGEPLYWNQQRARRSPKIGPNAGASQLEMAARQRGRDLLSRLSKLAGIVQGRSPDAITSGLVGETLTDELVGKRNHSETACGLTTPRNTDNALAWCAFWGIASIALVPRSDTPSRTATVNLAHDLNDEAVTLPVMPTPVSPARWSNICSSEQFAEAARSCAPASRAWLSGHGVIALVRFPVHEKKTEGAVTRMLLDGVVEQLS